MGSAEIVSDRPLAVGVFYTNTDGATRSYNSSNDGSDTLYVPAAYKNMWGITTGLVVQNTGYSGTSIYLYFYDRNGYESSLNPYSLGYLSPKKAKGLWLGNVSGLGSAWTGWVKIVSSNGNPLSTVVQTLHPGGRNAYNALSAPGKTVYLPRVVKDVGGCSTGYTVLNTSGSAITINASYYGLYGTEVWSRQFTIVKDGEIGQHLNQDPLG